MQRQLGAGGQTADHGLVCRAGLESIGGESHREVRSPTSWVIYGDRRRVSGTPPGRFGSGTGLGRQAALRPAAQEVEELRLQIRTRGWFQLGPEDVGLADHVVHRLESLVGVAN